MKDGGDPSVIGLHGSPGSVPGAGVAIVTAAARAHAEKGG